MNIVQNATEAKRELRKVEKMLRNFEILSKDLNAAIELLHVPGLKSARAPLERAKNRVGRSKELIEVRIKDLKVKPQIKATKKRSSQVLDAREQRLLYVSKAVRVDWTLTEIITVKKQFEGREREADELFESISRIAGNPVGPV